MDVVYNIQVAGASDPYITIAEKVLQLSTLAMLPGRFLVDVLPICASQSLSFPALVWT